MDRAPEQKIIDQLEAAGYKEDTIISYLEARVVEEWGRMDFADGACPEGQKMVFGICRNVGEDEVDKEGKPTGKKKEAKLTPEEEEVMKAAKAQGSSATNNRKVVVNGKSYGWAIQGGKPILVEWGKVAGEKKVGTGAKAGRGGQSGQSGRGGGRSGGGGIESLAQRAQDAWNQVPKEGRTPQNAARYAAAVATAQAADKALKEAERAAMPPAQQRRRGG